MKERSYFSLVRPKLEYASPIWNPSQKTQVKQIEQVQRNAARWVMNQPYSPHNPSSVTEMLNKLKWPSLEQRRVWTDVTLMYKVVNCLISVPVNYHPTTATVRSARRSHSMKFIPIQTRINAYQNSFFPRTVITWNMIPEPVLPLRAWMLLNLPSNSSHLYHPMIRRTRPCIVYKYVGR